MTKTVVEQFTAARAAGVPLLAAETPDSDALIERLLGVDVESQQPAVCWDYCRGMRPLNPRGEKVVAQIVANDPDIGGTIDPTVQNPAAAVLAVGRMKPFDDDGIVVFLQMAHRFFDDIGFLQALRNVRDALKADGRLLVLLGESMRLPLELRGHVVVLDEPLPDDSELLAIAKTVYEDNAESMECKLDSTQLGRVAETLRGTFAFGAETLAAMSLRSHGFDHETLQIHSRRLIEETLGLSVDRGGETFADIGGLEQAKLMGTLRFNGKRRPRLVVRIEELEKAMAGAKGDLSGTSTDILQVLLSEMEDNQYSGMLAFGAAGAGKSLYAKSLANTFGVLPMRLDVNGCKQSLVGQSEANIRAAMKVIHSIGGNDVFFVASMNRMDIPAELRRRFRAGVWFFDTPDKGERGAIWGVQLSKYGLGSENWQSIDEDDMTGADIRNICELAHDLAISLAEASEFTVLLKHSAPESIQEARRQADGRYNSASYKGRYRMDKEESKTNAKPRRQVNLRAKGIG